MHGLGGSADSYLALFNNPDITPVSPTTKIVLLTAPVRKVTKQNGEFMNSWMDIKLQDWWKYFFTKNLNELIGVDEAMESLKFISQILEEEIAIVGS